LALNSVTEEWKTFVQGILGLDQLPGWDQIWADLTQVETRQTLLKGSIIDSGRRGLKGVKEEENVAPALKGKGKGPSQGQGSQSVKKKKDLSKIKCFSCGVFGHYST